MGIVGRLVSGAVVLGAVVLLVWDTIAHGLDWGVVFALGVVIIVFGWNFGRTLWRRVRGDLL
jgi:hypothetical protein